MGQENQNDQRAPLSVYENVRNSLLFQIFQETKFCQKWLHIQLEYKMHYDYYYYCKRYIQLCLWTRKFNVYIPLCFLYNFLEID